MDKFSEMIQAVQDDLTAGEESSLFTPAIIKRAINRAYIKVGGLFRWSELEDALTTSTEANQDYYDYPRNWQPDSAWKLVVNGEDYGDPIAFRDYLSDIENQLLTSTDKAWSTFGRKFFIHSTPGSVGNNNITVWGQKTVTRMVNENDETIFSYAMPECNEAIVLEADAILKTKGEDVRSREMLSAEAKQILVVAWNKIRQNQAKFERTVPFLDVPDYFGRGFRRNGRSRIGNF